MDQKSKSIIDRLRDMREANPDLEELLEERFPEIRDESPFISAKGLNNVFIRRQYSGNLYSINCSSGGGFFIRNVTSDKTWEASHKEATGFNRYGHYLNKRDFRNMLKASGVKMDDIRFLDSEDLANLHRSKFNGDEN